MINLKLIIGFMLICFSANANLGSELDLNKKNLTPEQQEAKQMGEIFCEYCNQGWVENSYHIDDSFKEKRGNNFKKSYQRFINDSHRNSKRYKEQNPTNFSPYDESSCKWQSLRCADNKATQMNPTNNKNGRTFGDEKLFQIPVSKYCFETLPIFGKGIVDFYTQLDCDTDAKKIEELLKNDQRRSSGAYIVTNCYNVYETSIRNIYFLNPEEKQKYIDLMGYCAKELGDYLRSQGAVISR